MPHRRPRKSLDLSNPEVRKALKREADRLLKKAGVQTHSSPEQARFEQRIRPNPFRGKSC